ncbi:MAG: hypothetical protein BGO24_08105 [Sphingomonas sp. 67-36]|nr:MAG: hypothetical protein BGO24_08105 [Sphingomonas sp. 67-36]
MQKVGWPNRKRARDATHILNGEFHAATLKIADRHFRDADHVAHRLLRQALCAAQFSNTVRRVFHPRKL